MGENLAVTEDRIYGAARKSPVVCCVSNKRKTKRAKNGKRNTGNSARSQQNIKRCGRAVNELTIKPQDKKEKEKKRKSAVLELWSHDSLNKVPGGESFTRVLSAIGLTRKMF